MQRKKKETVDVKSATRTKREYTISETEFPVENLQCRGRMYLPRGVTKPPVVIMAHGYGAEMVFGLPAYAEAFAKAGFAVLIFDYRYFGLSDGEPRHYISKKAQLKDWESSVQFVRGLQEVDGNRICIWGCSFAGGHVIVTAAKDNGLRGFIAQVPFLDSLNFMKKTSVTNLLRLNVAAIRDFSRKITGRPPYSVRIIGQSDELAILNTPDSYEGYMAMVPDDSGWKNELPARNVMDSVWYRPIKYIPKINCRGLVLFAEHDSLIDADMVEKAFMDRQGISAHKYNCGHFDFFEGEFFRQAIEENVAFLKSIFT